VTLFNASSIEEIQEVVSDSSLMQEGVLPIGNGTRLERHSSLSSPNHLLSLSGMNQILDLNPSEQTCVVESGVSAAALNAESKKFGLELGVVSPCATNGTLGGLFLAGELSLATSLHGPPRDQVLGAEWMLADGTLVKSGGQVVKNVAGYDTTRLLLGSQGRLAICLSLCLRLKPISRHPQWGLLSPEEPTPFDSTQNLDYLFQASSNSKICFRADEASFTPEMKSHSCNEALAQQELSSTLKNFETSPFRYHSARVCDLNSTAGPVDFLGKIQGAASLNVPLRATAFPRQELSPWLQKIQEACAPNCSPFGGRIS
jgi:hypothetical protein